MTAGDIRDASGQLVQRYVQPTSTVTSFGTGTVKTYQGTTLIQTGADPSTDYLRHATVKPPIGVISPYSRDYSSVQSFKPSIATLPKPSVFSPITRMFSPISDLGAEFARKQPVIASKVYSTFERAPIELHKTFSSTGRISQAGASFAEKYSSVAKPVYRTYESASVGLRYGLGEDVSSQLQRVKPIPKEVKPFGEYGLGKDIYLFGTEKAKDYRRWQESKKGFIPVPKGITGKVIEPLRQFGTGIIRTPAVLSEMGGELALGSEYIIREPKRALEGVPLGLGVMAGGIYTSFKERPFETAGEFAGIGLVGKLGGTGFARTSRFVKEKVPYRVGIGEPKGIMIEASDIYMPKIEPKVREPGLVVKETRPAVEDWVTFAGEPKEGLGSLYLRPPKAKIGEVVTRLQEEMYVSPKSIKTDYGSYTVFEPISARPSIPSGVKLIESGQKLSKIQLAKQKLSEKIRIEKYEKIQPVEIEFSEASLKQIPEVTYDFEMGKPTQYGSVRKTPVRSMGETPKELYPVGIESKPIRLLPEPKVTYMKDIKWSKDAPLETTIYKPERISPSKEIIMDDYNRMVSESFKMKEIGLTTKPVEFSLQPKVQPIEKVKRKIQVTDISKTGIISEISGLEGLTPITQLQELKPFTAKKPLSVIDKESVVIDALRDSSVISRLKQMDITPTKKMKEDKRLRLYDDEYYIGKDVYSIKTTKLSKEDKRSKLYDDAYYASFGYDPSGRELPITKFDVFGKPMPIPTEKRKPYPVPSYEPKPAPHPVPFPDIVSYPETVTEPEPKPIPEPQPYPDFGEPPKEPPIKTTYDYPPLPRLLVFGDEEKRKPKKRKEKKKKGGYFERFHMIGDPIELLRQQALFSRQSQNEPINPALALKKNVVKQSKRTKKSEQDKGIDFMASW